MSEIARFLLIFPLQLLLFFGVPYWLWRRLKQHRPTAVMPPIVNDLAGGQVVPVVATFVGVRGLPWVALASNNLNPRLTITPDGMTFRVLRMRVRSFKDIEEADLRIFGATVLLSCTFHGSAFTFDVNLGSVPLAAAVLTLLPEWVPRSDRAAALARGDRSQSAPEQGE